MVIKGIGPTAPLHARWSDAPRHYREALRQKRGPKGSVADTSASPAPTQQGLSRSLETDHPIKLQAAPTRPICTKTRFLPTRSANHRRTTERENSPERQLNSLRRSRKAGQEF